MRFFLTAVVLAGAVGCDRGAPPVTVMGDNRHPDKDERVRLLARYRELLAELIRMQQKIGQPDDDTVPESIRKQGVRETNRYLYRHVHYLNDDGYAAKYFEFIGTIGKHNALLERNPDWTTRPLTDDIYENAGR